MRFTLQMMTAVFVFIPFVAMAAPVAVLSDVMGTVMVDQGNGFVKVTAQSPLVSGSRVMLARDGSATLDYASPNGCRLVLSANSITTVTSKSDCHLAAQVAGQANDPNQPVPPAGGATVGGLSPIVAPLMIAGAIAVIPIVADLTSDNPVSR
jgi:hypothetical protein